MNTLLEMKKTTDEIFHEELKFNPLYRLSVDELHEIIPVVLTTKNAMWSLLIDRYQNKYTASWVTRGGLKYRGINVIDRTERLVLLKMIHRMLERDIMSELSPSSYYRLLEIRTCFKL